MPSKNINQSVPDMNDRNVARPAFSNRCNADDLNSPCSIADVFDMEVQLSCDDCGHKCDKQFQQQRARILAALTPGSDFADQICSFINQKIGKTGYAQQGIIDHLEQDLASNGFYTTCYTNSGGGQKLWNQLNHKFIVVYQQWVKYQSGDMVIVDPNFKSQFQIAKPTNRYITILNMVPSVVVATPQQTQNLVTCLSKEMSIAFKEQGNSTPPWRSLSSLQSKWKINNTLQRSVSEPLQFFIQGEHQNQNQIHNFFKQPLGGQHPPLPLPHLPHLPLPTIKIIRADTSSSSSEEVEEAETRDRNQGSFQKTQILDELALGKRNKLLEGKDLVVQNASKLGNQLNEKFSKVNENGFNFQEYQKFQEGDVDKRRASLPSVSSELSALLREVTKSSPQSPTHESQNSNFNFQNQNLNLNQSQKCAPVIRGELFKAMEGQQSRTSVTS